MTDIGARNLMCAIVEQAVDDYKIALSGRNCGRQVAECERFFRSGYFELLNLTKMTGNDIIKEIKRRY